MEHKHIVPFYGSTVFLTFYENNEFCATDGVESHYAVECVLACKAYELLAVLYLKRLELFFLTKPRHDLLFIFLRRDIDWRIAF